MHEEKVQPELNTTHERIRESKCVKGHKRKKPHVITLVENIIMRKQQIHKNNLEKRQENCNET